MKTKYSNIILSIGKAKDTTDYKYFLSAIYNDGFSYPLTAFRTKRAVKKYLSDFGLKIGKRKGHLGYSYDIIGTYTRILVWNYSDFEAVKKENPKYILVTENGHKTIGLFKNNTLYVMNSNTDPFFKNSLIESNLLKMPENRRRRYLKLWSD